MTPLPQVSASDNNGTWQVTVSGQWDLETPWPANASQVLSGADDPGVKAVRISAADLGEWDSSLLLFVVELAQRARSRKLRLDFDLPEGLVRLVHMAFAVPPRKGAERSGAPMPFLERVGGWFLGLGPRTAGFLNFIGDVTLGICRLCIGRSRMRFQDFVKAMYECGVSSLPIVSLTSLLFGLILAFVGAVQLTQFGAQIYVAGLVGIGMLRVMGAIMVGVVLSGRIGASYAALLGTMQVNEEIDALETLGISPIDFLVVPRVLALGLMTPLLTVFADVMGILGGFLVGALMLGLNPLEYWHATTQMVHYRQMLIGLVYGAVFGVVIGICGCHQGILCGRSAMAVGQTTTRAVVYSLVGIIIMTAIITVICNILHV